MMHCSYDPDGCDNRELCTMDGKCHYTGRSIDLPQKSGPMPCDLCENSTICCHLGCQKWNERGAGKAPAADTSKPTNPKDAIGSDKIPFHLWPEIATAFGALGLTDGALKYGRANFRAIGVRASIYVDATRRHLAAWFEGETHDPDSGLPHLAHALACLAILVDAEAAGKLTDDRQAPGGYRAAISELTPHVARLRKLHEGKNPKHYTIKDAA